MVDIIRIAATIEEEVATIHPIEEEEVVGEVKAAAIMITGITIVTIEGEEDIKGIMTIIAIVGTKVATRANRITTTEGEGEVDTRGMIIGMEGEITIRTLSSSSNFEK